MKISAVIPARYASKRFPGKPLVKICQKTMIERVYRQVEKSKKFDSIIVATDDKRIVDVVRNFGGKALLTSATHTSGTDRIGEVLAQSDFEAVVNIQGDEPLISERLIADIYDQLVSKRGDVITAVYANKSYQDFLSMHIVKVVLNGQAQALYFSRSPIPYTDEGEFECFYQHIGIYAYTRRAIEKFVSYPKSSLEGQEKLEQLRFLENGVSIKVVFSDYQSIGVDTPDDMAKIENIIRGSNG